MKHTTQCVVLFAMVFALGTIDALGCTTFCLKNDGEVLFGKNYDWMIGDGLVFVNQRGVAKMSADFSETNVARWTSKYGSVTFNQYGWESPSGGMNEAGLVIELMWLDDTQWPAKDDRPAIDVLEWIQFNLDTASTVDQVISNSENVRIDSRVKLHYLVNDKSGNSATIEYLNGKLVAHKGKELLFAALTNDTYSRSIAYARQADMTQSESSLDRFKRAALKTKEFEKKSRSEQEAVDYAFSVLSDVAQKNSTQWSIVYDQKRAKIHFKTRKSPEIKTIDATAFDYGCGGDVRIFDMNSPNGGDVTKAFVKNNRAANRDLIERSFNGTDFLRNVPASAKDEYAEFPERFGCGTMKPVKKQKSKELPDNNTAINPFLLFNPLYWIYTSITSA